MLRKRSIIISGHATSVSMEEPFWSALRRLAERRGMAMSKIIAEIDMLRHGNLSSALRVYVLEQALAGEIEAETPDRPE